MAHFTNIEFSCVSIGFEPEHYEDKVFKNARSSSVVDFFYRRLEQIEREFSGKYDRIGRKDGLMWIKAVGLDVHPDLLPALEAATKISRYRLKSGHTAEGSDDKQKLDHREKRSMAKIITAMAIDGYGYDPEAKKSPFPKELQDIADKLGIGVTDDTIRSYLKLGAEMLPEDWKTE